MRFPRRFGLGLGGEVEAVKGVAMNTELDGHDGMILLLSNSVIAAHNDRETGDPRSDSELVRRLRQQGLESLQIAKVLGVLREMHSQEPGA
jgi:hypothetical protein